MTQLYYYVDDYTDEVIPCAPTLEGWAAWLALPADQAEKDWRGRGDIADGAEFRVSVRERLDDVVATLGADGWRLSRSVEVDADFFAEPWGDSWDIENSFDTLDGFLAIQVEHGATSIGDGLDVVVCRDLPDVVARFDATGPALIIVGPAPNQAEAA